VPKTVLLADHNLTIRRVVELTLADEDVTVVSVGDGDQAIDALSHLAPDLVLADIGMPGRTGYDVAQYVRSQPRTACIPVLLLAGAFEPVDHEQAQRVGADGILTKPFDPAVLVDRVKGLLATGRGGEAPAGPDAAPHQGFDSLVWPVDPAQRLITQQHAEGFPPPDTDLYFEQIDQAFASLAKSPRKPLPLEAEADEADEERRDTTQQGIAIGTPVRSVPVTPAPLPDAFAALLEAERAGVADAPVRFTGSAPSVPSALDVAALADQVARRVLAQLTDRVVRETVAQIVESTAERLVREEIDRIKRNIK